MRDLLVVIAIAIVAIIGTARSTIFNPSDSGVARDAKGIVVDGSGLIEATGSKNSTTTKSDGQKKPAILPADAKKAVVATTTNSAKPAQAKAVETKATPVVATPVVTDNTFPLEMRDAAAGVLVTVPYVRLTKPGWVAVHDQHVSGSGFGNTMGATWLPAGTHKNVSVELLRPTIVGKLYFVVLHADDGDKKYDSKKDLILTTDKNESVAFGFKAI